MQTQTSYVSMYFVIWKMKAVRSKQDVCLPVLKFWKLISIAEWRVLKEALENELTKYFVIEHGSFLSLL